jgi:hypothetical protein
MNLEKVVTPAETGVQRIFKPLKIVNSAFAGMAGTLPISSTDLFTEFFAEFIFCPGIKFQLG